MNISEIRLKNARDLAAPGGISAMAERLGKSQPQVSHLMGDNPIKNIGNIRSLLDKLDSATNLLAQSVFLFLLSLKFGYLPVIIGINLF